MTTSKEARRGLGPAWVAIALGALVALAFFASSRMEADVAALPLELDSLSAIAAERGTVLVSVTVRNVDERPVEVLDVAVPEVAPARFGTGSNHRSIPIAPRDTGQFLLRLPACSQTPSFERLEVLVQVDGREVEQTLRLGDALELDCS